MDCCFSSLRYSWAFTLFLNVNGEAIKRLDWILFSGTFDKCFFNERINFILRLRYTLQLIDKSSVFDQETDWYMLDLEHLCQLFPLINVNVKVFQSAISFNNCFSNHRFENLARIAPGCTGLNKNRSLLVLHSCSPLTRFLHLSDKFVRLLWAFAELSNTLLSDKTVAEHRLTSSVEHGHWGLSHAHHSEVECIGN